MKIKFTVYSFTTVNSKWYTIKTLPTNRTSKTHRVICTLHCSDHLNICIIKSYILTAVNVIIT